MNMGTKESYMILCCYWLQQWCYWLQLQSIMQINWVHNNTCENQALWHNEMILEGYNRFFLSLHINLTTRSSRRVHNMALYHSNRPNSQIRIHHWSACSICTVLHTSNFGAHTSWRLLCLLNFSTCVFSDKQKTTFSILTESCVAQISTVTCRLWLWWEWRVMLITVHKKDCWKYWSLQASQWMSS